LPLGVLPKIAQAEVLEGIRAIEEATGFFRTMKAQLAGSQLSYAASVALGNFWKASMSP